MTNNQIIESRIWTPRKISHNYKFMGDPQKLFVENCREKPLIGADVHSLNIEAYSSSFESPARILFYLEGKVVYYNGLTEDKKMVTKRKPYKLIKEPYVLNAPRERSNDQISLYLEKFSEAVKDVAREKAKGLTMILDNLEKRTILQFGARYDESQQP